MNKKLFGFVFVFILVFTFFTKISFAGNPPTITSFSPASGNVGDLIKIFGDNLTPVDTIFFGTKEAYLMDIHPISSKEIEVFVPNDAVTGKIKVKTTNGEVSSINDFEVVSVSTTPKVAEIARISPTSGEASIEGKNGTEITIEGFNIGNINELSFNGTIAIPSTTQGGIIKVYVPKGATTGKIYIKTADYGEAWSSVDFIVTSTKSETPTCSDGIKNQDETGIDTGGICSPLGGGDPTINGKKVTFNGLVPDCNTGTVDPTTGQFPNPCDFNYFMALINKIIKFLLFTIATPLVALIIMYTGWLFISAGGSAGQTEKAKHILFNVVIGYVIALIAWLLINAILSIFDIPSDSVIYSFLKK